MSNWLSNFTYGYVSKPLSICSLLLPCIPSALRLSSLSFSPVAQHHPLPGPWLLPLSVTSPFTGWAPTSGPGQGELFSPCGANLLRLPHPLTGRGLEPKTGLTFQQPQRSFHSHHAPPVRESTSDTDPERLSDFPKNAQLMLDH